jgi:septum site-determining protein MinD
LWLLPASQIRDKDALTEQGVADVIKELRAKFDWVICDSPAGIERGATLAMRFADAAVIVTNPEVSSVRDSDRIIGLLDSKTEKAEKGQHVEKHILITRYDPQRAARGEMLNIDDVLDILSTPLLGIIPESKDVLHASNVGSPITVHNAASAPARAYVDAAGRLRVTIYRWPSTTTARACLTSCSGGKPHDLLQHIPATSLRARRARAAPDFVVA